MKISLLSLCCFLAVGYNSPVAGEKCLLPPLADSFQSEMQLNAAFLLRSEEEGISVAISESVYKDEKANIQIRAETNFNQDDNGRIMTVDNVVWNQDLDGVDNFLNFFTIAGFEACFSDKVQDNSLFYLLFGFNNDPPRFPSVTNMLHFGPGDNYQCGGEGIEMNIPVSYYETMWQLEEYEGHINITYAWSNPTRWHSSAGTNISVPVSAKLFGLGKFDPNSEEPVFFDTFIDFVEFFEIAPDESLYLPPRPDLFCEGRRSEQDLPEIPNAFHYNSEVIYHYKSEDLGLDLNIVAPREEWYDYSTHASKTRYKPLDFNNLDDPFAGKSGFISVVKDFLSGIEYTTYEDYGNCSAKFIGTDASGDVSVGEDGTIHMTTPFEMFHTNLKYAANGVYSGNRGFDMSYYISQTWEGASHLNEDPSVKDNFTTVMALSGGKYMVEGDDDVKLYVPVAMERYPNLYFNDPHKRLQFNIIGFEGHEPDMMHYDVTTCFVDKEMDHRAIRIGWREDMDIYSDAKEFRDAIRAQAAIGAGVTLLRIQNIQMDLIMDESSIYTQFTVIDYPNSIGSPPEDMAPEASRPLPEAIETLEKYILEGNFIIDVPVQGGGFAKAAADKDYFESVDRDLSGCGASGNNNNNGGSGSKGKYTGGDMALLALGMIVLGMLIAGAIYWFKFRNNVRSTMSNGIRGFDNPLSGTDNLPKM